MNGSVKNNLVDFNANGSEFAWLAVNKFYNRNVCR